MLLAEISVFDIVAWTVYGVLVLMALWGLFCVVVVWMRVGQGSPLD